MNLLLRFLSLFLRFLSYFKFIYPRPLKKMHFWAKLNLKYLNKYFVPKKVKEKLRSIKNFTSNQTPQLRCALISFQKSWYPPVLPTIYLKLNKTTDSLFKIKQWNPFHSWECLFPVLIMNVYDVKKDMRKTQKLSRNKDIILNY